jgi:hypothetical protein
MDSTNGIHNNMSSIITAKSFSNALEQSIKVRTTKGKKRVSFSNAPAGIVEVKSLEDFSKEELEQTWFTRQEFDDIKESYRSVLRRMQNKEHIQDTEECSTRGLEGRSRMGARNRQTIMMESILAVLNEQMEQQNEGRNDSEAIAIAYRQYGYHSLQAAVMMGRRDQEAVMAQNELPGRVSEAGGSPHGHLNTRHYMTPRSVGGPNLVSMPTAAAGSGRRSFTSPLRRPSRLVMNNSNRRRAAAA